MNEETGALDKIIQELGHCGKYNIFTFMLLSFPVFLTGIYYSQFIFVAGDINYRCYVPECESLNNSDWIDWAIPLNENQLHKCQRYFSLLVNTNSSTDDNAAVCASNLFDRDTIINCDKYVYDAENTIVKEFDLGCQDWKRTLVGSMHNAGYFISVSVTGLLSDRFGRKTLLIITSLINGFVGVLRSFSINFAMFISLEFLETVLGGALYCCLNIIMIEIVTPKNRIYISSLKDIIFAIGSTIPAFLAWIIPEWRTNLRIMYAPAFITFAYIWLLDESARWFLVKGKHEDAIEILKKISKVNNIEISDTLYAQLERKPIKEKTRVVIGSHVKEIDQRSAINKRKPTLLQVLSSRILLGRVIICTFLWITCTFTYFGLNIHSTSLSGNKYFNYIIVCLIEIPSYIVSMMVVNRVGRRITINITFILTGIICVSLAFIPKDLPVASLLLFLSGKFSITLAFNCVNLFVSEVFPTNLRQSLYGCCSSIGRIGSVLAPQVPLMAIYMESLPSLLFGIMALTSGLLSLILPETTNLKLPDTIEEAEQLTRKKT